ncbi:hypothetical protein DENIS_4872 [Desulfonema ishimotonii]|uniref:Uncharacterized protein n=1 Tax=Desulfonema ishimotonii TaxID=45657 RepID=A0A401G3U7_9BACT|nr:hypothetical protein DENIS_4872 [Desulfonema ishimotonii]
MMVWNNLVNLFDILGLCDFERESWEIKKKWVQESSNELEFISRQISNSEDELWEYRKLLETIIDPNERLEAEKRMKAYVYVAQANLQKHKLKKTEIEHRLKGEIFDAKRAFEKYANCMGKNGNVDYIYCCCPSGEWKIGGFGGGAGFIGGFEINKFWASCRGKEKMKASFWSITFKFGAIAHIDGGVQVGEVIYAKNVADLKGWALGDTFSGGIGIWGAGITREKGLSGTPIGTSISGGPGWTHPEFGIEAAKTATYTFLLGVDGCRK